MPGVTSFNDYAFERCSVKRIVVPDTVTYIGKYCFSESYNLTSIVISDNVTEIGYYAFYSCTNLLSVKLPNNLTSIKPYTFYNCRRLNSIEIPKNVTEIGQYAFYNCENLTRITLPDKITSVSGFLYCKSLEYVYVGSLINDIEDQAFNNKCLIYFNVSENNEKYESFEGSLYLKNPLTLYKYYFNSTLKKGIKSIGSYAFYQYSNLTSFDIPETVTSIQDYAFAYCDQLTTINLHDNIISTGSNAFLKCTSVISLYIGSSLTTFDYQMNINYGYTNFTVSKDNAYFESFEGSLYMKNSLTLLKFYRYSKSKFKEGVTTLADYSFSSCSINDIVIPDTVTSIGIKCFDHCRSLESVVISDNVNEIKKDTFSDCNYLEIVILGKNVHTINESAFYGCYRLTSIVFPKNLNYIRESAFTLTNLKFIVFCGSNLSYSGDPFRGVSPSIVFYTQNKPPKNDFFYGNENASIFVSIDYPNETIFGRNVKKNLIINENNNDNDIDWLFNIDTCILYLYGSGIIPNYEYKMQTPWSFFSPIVKEIVLMNYIRSIGTYSFYKYDSLLSVNLSSPIDLIETNAFAESSYLTLVSFKGTVKNFSNYAFANTGITTINYYGSDEPICESNVFRSQYTPNINSIKVFVKSCFRDYKFCGIRTSDSHLDYNGDDNEAHKPIKFPSIKSYDNYYAFIYIDPYNLSDTFSLSDEINKKFDKNWQHKNKIALIYSNNFTYDLTSNNSCFIRPKKDSLINFINGNLNLNLEKSKNVTVFINNSKNNQNISVIGNGELNIKLLNNYTNNIKFDNNIKINDEFKITVPDSIDTVIIDSITFESNSFLTVNNENEKRIKNLIFNKINIPVFTNVNLSDSTISKKLQIYQTSKIKLENVSYENADIEYIVFNYDNSKYSFNPFIGNSFKHLPKSFVLLDKKFSNSRINKINYSYPLIEGFSNEHDCNKWLEIIELNQTYFNSKYCDENNSLIIKAEVFEVKQKRAKIGKNEIIGISVGCVATAIIVVSLVLNNVLGLKDPVENDNSLSS